MGWQPSRSARPQGAFLLHHHQLPPNGSCVLQLAHAKGEEIEDLLGRLSDVNDSLSSILTGAGDPRSHTLARHRDILHDYTQVRRAFEGPMHDCCSKPSTTVTGLLMCAFVNMQEVRRLQAALGAARDRAELFAGSGESSPLQQGTSSTGLLLRERGNLQNTNTAVRQLSSARADQLLHDRTTQSYLSCM